MLSLVKQKYFKTLKSMDPIAKVSGFTWQFIAKADL